jgi:hypothetical protein
MLSSINLLKFGVGNSCLSITAFSFIHMIYCTYVSIIFLKFGVGILCFNIVAFCFIHMIYCTFVPSNYVSQTIIVMTCNRSNHKHDKPLVSSVRQKDMFFYHIFQYHGLKIYIIHECGPYFISKFWKRFLELLSGMENLLLTFHPQINGQTK